MQALFYSRRRRLWFKYDWDWRAGARCFFLCASALVFFHSYFSQSVWGTGGCKRLYTLGGGACCMHTSGTGRRARGICFFVLPPLHLFIYIFPGVCEGQGVQALFSSRRRRLWYAYKWDGRAGARFFFFVCFGPCIFPFVFLPKCVRDRRGKRLSTLGGGVCGLYTSATGGKARGIFSSGFRPCTGPFTFVLVCVGGRRCKHLYFSVYMSPGVCGGQGMQAPCYFRRRRLWYAYKWDGRAHGGGG